MAREQQQPYRTYLIDPFGRTLYVATRPREWRALRTHFDDCLPENPGVGRTDRIEHEPTDTFEIVVWLNRKHPDVRRDTMTVVAHEAAHAAKFLLDGIGETTRTHEVEPYLVGWIAGKLWDALRDGH